MHRPFEENPDELSIRSEDF